jgi:hypothetical protein
MMHSLSDDDDDDNDDDDDDDIMMILSNNIAQKALTVNPGRLSSFIIWRSIFICGERRSLLRYLSAGD